MTTPCFNKILAVTKSDKWVKENVVNQVVNAAGAKLDCECSTLMLIGNTTGLQSHTAS